MADALTDLERTLVDAGFRTIELATGDGRLLITPHGARVLGATLADVEGNLFWHNPDLEHGPRVRDAMEAGAIGGDRLWIAPEVAFMWPDLKQARIDPFSDYRLPPAMDPGQWQRVGAERGEAITFRADMALTDHRTGKTVSLTVEREIAACDRPEGLPDALAHLGLTLRNDLAVVGGDEGAVAGVWDLVQVPAGRPRPGELICPTVQPVTSPRRYYETYEGRVRCDREAVRFTIDAQRQIKMGIDARHTAGRMAYYRQQEGVSTVIFRAFLPMPGEVYVDLPRDSDAFFGGDALQAYNDNGGFGQFGEMEYHDPAIVVGRGPQRRSGSCVTHLLAGPDAEVREAVRMLVGVDVSP
jgi:hypothetical protein